MGWKHGVPVALVMMQILTKHVATSREDVVSDDAVTGRRWSLDAGCQSCGDVDDDVHDSAEVRGETTWLGGVGRGRLERRPTESKDSEDAGGRRRRRSVRPVKTVTLAETSRGQLVTLGTDYAERFAFDDPPPPQLDISAVMGNVMLRHGHRLDYETQPEMEFVVIVTRVDDVTCEYQLRSSYFRCCVSFEVYSDVGAVVRRVDVEITESSMTSAPITMAISQRQHPKATADHLVSASFRLQAFDELSRQCLKWTARCEEIQLSSVFGNLRRGW